MDQVFKDFLNTNLVRTEGIAVMETEGVNNISDFIHSAVDAASFESGLIAKVKTVSNPNIGQIARVRAAWKVAKDQNPNLVTSPSQNSNSAFVAGLDNKLIVSDEFIEKTRSKYKTDHGHEIFECKDPANTLISEMLKEEQQKKYKVTIYSNMKTRTEEREKEFRDMGRNPTKLELIGKNLHLANDDKDEDKNFSFYNVTGKLRVLAVSWELVGRCNEWLFEVYLIQKMKEYAKNFPNRKLMILAAESKIRDLWLKKKTSGISWEDAIKNSSDEADKIFIKEVVNKMDPITKSKVIPKAMAKAAPKNRSLPYDKSADHLSFNFAILEWNTVDSQNNSVQICYDYSNGNGCSQGDECPRAHKCALRSCGKDHSVWEIHPNLRSTVTAFMSKGRGKGKGGKGKGKGKAKGKGKGWF